MKPMLPVLSIVCCCALGCLRDTGRRPVIEWRELSHEELAKEVEHRSRPDQVWHYQGSDGRFHYLWRTSLQYFLIGKRSHYFKVPKAGCAWLTAEEEFPLDSFGLKDVFSKHDDTRKGLFFTHVVSRGIVEYSWGHPVYVTNSAFNATERQPK